MIHIYFSDFFRFSETQNYCSQNHWWRIIYSYTPSLPCLATMVSLHRLYFDKWFDKSFKSFVNTIQISAALQELPKAMIPSQIRS